MQEKDEDEDDDAPVTPERSRNMSRIRSRDTKPEILVRKLLFAEGFRFRICRRGMPGTPDVVLRKWKTVVFVHGCFWHRHEGCSRATTPGTRQNYWNEKFRRNRERDAVVRGELFEQGWRVLVVWECACRKSLAPALQARMKAFLLGQEQTLEIGAKDLC